MRIGVVADTHGYFDPHLRRLLAGVEAILHAGDVGSQVVLDELRAIAPVHAVRGNVDGPELGLSPSRKLDFGDLRIEMMHILPLPQSELEAWSAGATPGGKAPARSERLLKTFDESTGVVIFGHSHQPCLVNLGDRLFFNPGSAGKKRFSLPRCCGLLEATAEGIEATVRLLENYPGRILQTLRLDVGIGEEQC
ncbi:MAG TPA: metallophosphoesterase family protein [Terriglobia bacterium]|nr:metallophosphoesterase family protein [Terriglobia bacterium]